MHKFWTKTIFFGYFGARIIKNCCHIWNQHPRIYLISKFCQTLKFPTIFYQKCVVWVIFSWNLKTILSYLKSVPQICQIANFREKLQMPKVWTKTDLFKYFGVRILKYYCHFWNLHPWICQTAKLYEKKNIPQFGTKNVLFQDVRTRI